MDPAFDISGTAFFAVSDSQAKAISDYLGQTSGVFAVPDTSWRTDLATFPSPLRSPDAIKVYVSGTIPTTTSSLGDTVLDVVRRESRPKAAEPDYNTYRHLFIKDTTGTLFVSAPVKPEHHWATSGELHQIYGF